MSVLVTGGAGYIGAHIVRTLKNSDKKVFIADNFSTGNKERIKNVEFFEIDLAKPEACEALQKIFLEKKISSVIHIAAKKQVGESVAHPTWYYEQNVHSMTHLLQAMENTQTKKLVFSSSAASYGNPNVNIITEETLANPINPYGQTKLICEWMAENAKKAWGLQVASLRYFNVAGAGWADLADPETLNLIPIILDAIKNNQTTNIYGNDYNTPDGTCIRDYIHISDLAEAHIAALKYLDTQTSQESSIFNIGTGTGASVKEVINKIKEISGKNFNTNIAKRRAGDPPKLVADVSKAKKVLNWQAKHDLTDIITSAWNAN